jgi:hypothetical protein
VAAVPGALTFSGRRDVEAMRGSWTSERHWRIPGLSPGGTVCGEARQRAVSEAKRSGTPAGARSLGSRRGMPCAALRGSTGAITGGRRMARPQGFAMLLA